ncbi:class I SAM-dependent methyltransferase [Nocardia sp. NPDC058658]|uniref:class I SAM-dependent methyltransferase n=1 Tax=Nocardia sp. NPDC058658 TaxID=3346580 RepID=UPI00364BBAFA
MNLARKTMNAPALAAVYEHAWRPTLFYLASGRTTGTDRREAVDRLRLSGPMKVLDLACGPGNFTEYLSTYLTRGGFVTGLDYSPAMLAKAATDNASPRVGYVRGDARTLPFADGTFDAVCCFGALYLIPDPLTATREMIRVLKPGGRIAISTSYRENNLFGSASSMAASLSGLRLFDRDTFPKLFVRAGLTEVDQRVHRFMQYVDATKPL